MALIPIVVYIFPKLNKDVINNKTKLVISIMTWVSAIDINAPIDDIHPLIENITKHIKMITNMVAASRW